MMRSMSGQSFRRTLVTSLLLLSCLLPAAAQLHAAAASGAFAKEEIGDITLFTAKALFDTHSACFVDARPEYSYYTSHIKGARSLSESRFDEQLADFRQKITAGTLLVVYCIGPNCPKARHVAEKLKNNGYRNIKVFSGGLAAWTQAGFPIEE